jgi:hypothetical protein
MTTRIAQMVLLVALLTSSLAMAQTKNPARMWYRGAFDGWVTTQASPAYGHYYRPCPNPAYPLNEAQYGQPVPCAQCGHVHYPGQDICPYCGQTCAAGGNNLDPNTVYTQRRLPGQYWYKEQPHYRTSIGLGGTYQKYTHRLD